LKPVLRAAFAFALAAVVAAAVSGCGGSGATLDSTAAATEAPPTPSLPTSTVPEGALDLAVPSGAFPPAVITGFEAASGCEVALAGWPAETDQSRLRRALGSVDLVAMRADAIRPLATARLLLPLDSDGIDGIGKVSSRLRKLQAVALNGNSYGVAYAWEPLALLSLDSAFPDGPPTSLRVLWEPARAASVALPDDPLTLATAALSVGVDDPFALDAADLAASDELLRLARITHRWSSVASLESLLASGSVTLAIGPPQVALALRGRADVTATIPVEGAVALVRTLAMPARAPHPVCAYRFLSYMLQPTVQAAIAAGTQLTPVVSSSCRALGSRRCTTLHAGDQWSQRMQFARRPVPPSVPWSRWIADWRSLR
jgi:putative spermidine/putrescine transport system substrate-binding protein